MFTPRAMFFFPMLDKSSGNNVTPKTTNFRNLILVDLTVIDVKLIKTDFKKS